MLKRLRHFFEKATPMDNATQEIPNEHDVRVATCALLVEIARIDETFSPEELEVLLSILNDKYGLNRKHAQDLIAEAEKELENSVDLWQFARLINENYTNAEKIEIIETLWRIVFVDGRMDKYEHYLMNKLQSLLRISHKELIDAKLKVKYRSDEKNDAGMG